MDEQNSNFIDISVNLRNGMVHWPSDPPIEIKRSKDMEKGDSNTVSNLSMGTHTGTHMDAPFHFIKSGNSIDEMPFSATIGKARVLEIKDSESIKPEELSQYSIKKGERILFKTLNSERCWKDDDFIKDFVYISNEAGKYLAEKGVMTVGVDYLSVGGYKKNTTEIHNILLNAGIWIIEGLNLSDVRPGEYELICLPLKIYGGDGAPTRAILKKIRT